LIPRRGSRGEEGDSTPDLVLKHLDATITTYLKTMKYLKYAYETITKILEKHFKLL
jgi:hypothetical protein